MIDVIPAAEDVPGKAECMVSIQEALSLLMPQEQKVVKATILDGFTHRETARELGVLQAVVNRVKKRALNKLKKRFVLDEPTGK